MKELEKSIKYVFITQILLQIKEHYDNLEEISNYISNMLMPLVQNSLLNQCQFMFKNYDHLNKLTSRELGPFVQLMLQDYVKWGIQELKSVGNVKQAHVQPSMLTEANKQSNKPVQSCGHDDDKMPHTQPPPNNVELALRLEQLSITIEPYLPKFIEFFPVPRPIDRRKSWNEGEQHVSRKVRRLDSLARLLSFPDRWSVCSAVALDCSESPIENSHKMVLALNRHNEVEVNILQSALTRRITHLRHTLINFYLSMIKDAEPLAPLSRSQLSQLQQSFEAHCNDPAKKEDTLFHQIIEKAFGISFPPAVFQQAYLKIFHALFIDQETFTPNEKRGILFGEVVSLIPSDDLFNTFIPFFRAKQLQPIVLEKNQMSLVHAEQLIALYFWYTKEVRDIKVLLPIAIGISKLCCETCYQALHAISEMSGIPFEARGGHDQQYPGVINLITMQPTVITKTNRSSWAITCADASNFNSPFLGPAAYPADTGNQEEVISDPLVL